jgi:di/tricarboxylate transporter
MLIIPAGCAIGFGWGGYQHGDWWGPGLLITGVSSIAILIPVLWKQGW